MKGWIIAGLLLVAGCGGDTSGDVYVGKWEGVWHSESKGKATATVVKTESGYRAELVDEDGDVVTWIDGSVGDEGLDLESADDAPDRYLSKWRGFIAADGKEFIGQSYPSREFGGFVMRRGKGD